MENKIIEKIEQCDKKTLSRLETISKVKVFDEETDDYVRYENRKTIRNQLLNNEFRKYAMLHIA